MAFVHTSFTSGTVGERFLRIDSYGVCEQCTSDAGSTSVTVTSLGGGTTVLGGVVGSNIQLKTLVAGTNITFAPVTADEITINSAGGGGGGVMNIVDSGTGDETLVQTGAAPTPVIKKLTAGAGITLGSDADQVTISAPGGATYTLADVAGGTGTTLVGAPSPNPENFRVYQVKGGAGISTALVGSDVVITNTAAGQVYTLSNDAGITGTGLVAAPSPNPEDFRLYAIKAGAGIGVALVGSDVTITNTGVAQVYTLADAAGGTGTSIVDTPAPTANDFRVRQIKGGSGISVALVGTDVVITNTGGGGGAGTLNNASGTSIITDGVGPDFTIKGQAVSNLLAISSTGTTFSWDNVCIKIRSGGALPAIGNDASVGASGNQVAIGPNSSTTSDNSCSIGINCDSTTRSQVFGRANTNAALDSILFGTGITNSNAAATQACVFAVNPTLGAGANVCAFGSSVTATGNRTVAIGNAASASASEGVAIGRLAVASGASAVAYGWGATASGLESVSLGRLSVASGANAVSLGYNANSSASSGIAIGSNADCNFFNSICIGLNSTSNNTNQVCIGTNSNANATDAIAIGTGATSTAANAVVMGNSCSSSGSNSVSIGFNSSITGTSAIVIGNGSSAINSGICIGAGSSVITNLGGIAIGNSAICSGGGVQIGGGTNGVGASLRFRSALHIRAEGSGDFFFLANLRTTDPGAGSKEFWVDTGDGNTVKYRP